MSAMPANDPPSAEEFQMRRDPERSESPYLTGYAAGRKDAEADLERVWGERDALREAGFVGWEPVKRAESAESRLAALRGVIAGLAEALTAAKIDEPDPSAFIYRINTRFRAEHNAAIDAALATAEKSLAAEQEGGGA